MSDKLHDATVVINGQSIEVIERDENGYIIECSGLVTITDAGAGYAQGCVYHKDNGDNTTTDYINEGDEASCDFNDVKAGEMGAADLAADSVDSSEIAADAVGASEIATGAVGSDEIAADAVGASEIATDAVGTDEIDDGTVTANDLHNDALKDMEVLDLPQLPAPTGSNQLNNDLFMFAAPMNARVTGVTLVSDTATSGSDATNRYEFEVYNTTQAQSLSSAPVVTSAAELAAGTPYALTVDQNQDIQNGDVMVVRVDILDDGSAGPTDLSSANIKCQVNWNLRA